ncbi:MAG: TetR/AcrR family transcriptional regulator [Rhodobacteraceae bacterium]|nr:TetR/AcrR family transcriptional regulator [Paracoccaceae bacterium]
MNIHPSRKMDADKRAQLFDVAIREFVAHGFGKASLNRIIREVKMSKSSFYHYFSNKTELFKQIMHQSLDPFMLVLEDFDFELLTTESFWPTLKETSQQAVGMFIENPQIILLGRMFYKSLEEIKEQGLTWDFMQDMQGFVTKFLKRGQVLGVIRDDLPDSFLITSVIGLGMSIDRWMIENFHTIDPKEFDYLNIQTLDMFERLLAPTLKE